VVVGTAMKASVSGLNEIWKLIERISSIDFDYNAALMQR
jgi:hypothetical protein